MDIEELKIQWKDDCKIDLDRLDQSSKDTYDLFSKYMNIFADTRKELRKLNREKTKLYQLLTLYYGGVIDGKDIGREPFQIKINTKTQMDSFIKSDDLMAEMDEKITEVDDKLLYLKEVITNINSRSYSIGNAISFMRWSNGEI